MTNLKTKACQNQNTSKMEKMEHFSHEHPLVLIEGGEEVVCSGCEEPISGHRYSCSSCLFVLHKSCATLPLEINHPMHPDHLLTLLSSSPYRGRYICDSCKRVRSNFVYHCRLCGFDLDIPCASLCLPREPETSKKDEEQEEPKYLLGHDHALKLVEEQNPQYADKLCDACVGPITYPFFTCVQNCGFFLHQSCSELPKTKQHRFHPHELTLYPKAPHNYDGIYKCDSCKSLSNGFVYRCDECQFDLDVCCAVLGETLKHDSHKHPLVLEKSSVRRICKGCNVGSKHVFVCDVCDEFAIDTRCATLPSTTWHVYDKHPLRLTYGVGEEHNYYCGICKKRCGKQWFYNCDDCAFYAHTYCVVGKSRRVKFGGSFKYDNHEHPLTLVEEIIEEEGECDACGEGCFGWGLKCGECKKWMHREGDCFWDEFKKSEKYSALSGTMKDRYAANVLAATPYVSLSSN